MNDFCLFEDSELRPCEQQAMDCDMCEYNELFQIAVAKAKEEALRDCFMKSHCNTINIEVTSDVTRSIYARRT